MSSTIFGETYRIKAGFPIAGKFKRSDFLKIDLSKKNPDLKTGKTDDVEGLSHYIFGKIEEAGVKCAFGGYAEKRDLYKRSKYFSSNEEFRSVHLGIDFWMPAGTPVVASIPGRVHSFKNNDNPGDYGPTIILEHLVENQIIHSLYGHLSKSSLEGLKLGQLVARGEEIGTLGTPDVNRDWPPHLHFQLIRDIGENRGDYIGVCHKKDKKYYLKNCPNPIAFFESDNWKMLAQ